MAWSGLATRRLLPDSCCQPVPDATYKRLGQPPASPPCRCSLTFDSLPFIPPEPYNVLR